MTDRAPADFRPPPGSILLLDRQTLVMSSGWTTTWVRFPVSFAAGQLVLVCYAHTAGSGASITLQTTYDTADVTDVLSAITVAAVGVTVQDATSGLGPLVRLSIATAASSRLVLSVWITPKS